MKFFGQFAAYVMLLCVIGTGTCLAKPAQHTGATFATGKERMYNLLNDVRLHDHKRGPAVAYRLTGSLRVGSVWGGDELKLLQFHLSTPQLHIPARDSTTTTTDPDDETALRFVSQTSLLDAAVNRPFYAVWHLGAITKVYVHGKEDPSLVNLKKALIGLFQYQLLDGEYDEHDAAGSCAVGYASSGRSAFEKVWRRCAEYGTFHRRADRPVGVRVESDARRAEYRVTDDGTLEKVTVHERHRYVLAANERAGAELRSTFTLRFDGSISNIETLPGGTPEEAAKTVKGLKRQTLETDVEVPHGRKDAVPFKTAVVQQKDALTNDQIGTDRAALALIRLAAVSPVVDMAGFLKVLKAHTMQELRPQLIDVLAATQTVEAHEAAKRTVRFASADDSDLAERYLQGLAVGTRPQPAVIEELVRQAEKTAFEEPKVRDTLVQTVAAMAHRLARLPNSAQHAKVIERVQTLLTSSLTECTDTDCKELYLRALNNLQSPETVDELIDYLGDSDRRLAVAAAKALRRFPVATWTAEHRQQFIAIFYQLRRGYDSSVRTLALDVLLELEPTDAELQDFVRFLHVTHFDRAYEVRKYLLQKLQLLATRCPLFAGRLRAIIVANPRLNNYHVLAQRGLTTALQRRFAQAPSFNGTVLSVQEMHKGVLRRGIVDMSVAAGGEEFSVFTLGLWAGGLSSFVSSGDAGDDNADDQEAVDEEPANAGMEVTVQGAYFRPLQFFGSQGELMGHAWSGTASEPTAAYRATTLLHDHREVVRLLNGAAVSVRVLGAVSIDLSGQVQFSLWNRNAHCQVDKNAGIAVEGSMAVETSFVNLKAVATVTQEPKLVVLADIDFAGAPKLCIQLSQPETELKHEIEKITKVHGTNVLRSNTQTHRYHLPGVTHALNQKNNEMCGSILADDS